jgi:predicted transcriptional regulator
MASAPLRRIFAGDEVRRLRLRSQMSQAAFARTVGISVPYLSQIENNGRPVTTAVSLALSRAFPHAADIYGDDAALIAAASAAASDGSIPEHQLGGAELARAVERQPALARRLVALHAAYRRTQDQLLALDDAVGTGGEARLPWEEVRDWFQGEGNYSDPLDRAAETLAERIEASGAGLEEWLQDAHGVRTTAAESASAELRRFDPTSATLHIDRALPPESARFLVAHQLVQIEMREAIATIVNAARLRHDASRQLLAAGLGNYAAGALLMPYERFRATAQAMRHDIDRLRGMFGVSFEQACHRLSTLQRPGASGIPLFFLRVDMAGNITKRHSATPLQFARFGGACPLWVVHEAVAIPDRILVQRAEMPDGTRYVSMAKGLVKPSGSFARSPRRYAVALGCEEGDAATFIYADAVIGGPATPIGVSCRICPRANCDQRAFPPAAATLTVDADARAVVPYRFA